MEAIKDTLNSIGLSGVWMMQQYACSKKFSEAEFQSLVKRKLQDQFIQSWLSKINNNELFYNYRLFKDNFGFEKYLTILPTKLALSMTKFRTLNHKMPIQKGRMMNVNRDERYCSKCMKRDLGDEFHYLFVCDFFANERKELLKGFYYKHPNVLRFATLLGSHKKKMLLELSKFMSIIIKSM